MRFLGLFVLPIIGFLFVPTLWQAWRNATTAWILRFSSGTLISWLQNRVIRYPWCLHFQVWHWFYFRCGIRYQLKTLLTAWLLNPTLIFIQNVLMEAKQAHHLRQEVVLGKHAFSLLRIKWLEVLFGDKFFVQTFLNIVLLEHCKFNQVRISYIIQNCIAQDF